MIIKTDRALLNSPFVFIVLILLIPVGVGSGTFFLAASLLFTITALWLNNKKINILRPKKFGAVLLYLAIISALTGLTSFSDSWLFDTGEIFRYILYYLVFELLVTKLSKYTAQDLAEGSALLLLFYSFLGLLTPLIPDYVLNLYSSKIQSRFIFPDALHYEHLAILVCLYCSYVVSSTLQTKKTQFNLRTFLLDLSILLVVPTALFLCYSKISLLATFIVFFCQLTRIFSYTIIKIKSFFKSLFSLKNLPKIAGLTSLIALILNSNNLSHSAFSDFDIQSALSRISSTDSASSFVITINIQSLLHLLQDNLDTTVNSGSYSHRLSEFSEIVEASNPFSLIVGNGSFKSEYDNLGESGLAFMLMRFGIIGVIIYLFLFIMIFSSIRAYCLSIFQIFLLLILIFGTTSPFSLRTGIAVTCMMAIVHFAKQMNKISSKYRNHSKQIL